MGGKDPGSDLNTQYTHSQLFGAALYRRAGLPAQESRAVQVRVNNANLIVSGSPSYGFYVHNEVVDSDFAARNFPLDSGGNIYRGKRKVAPGANLTYLGDNPNPYRTNYFKKSNGSEDDSTDLIDLTKVLSTTPDSNYVAEVQRTINVQEWMRYFAMETLDDNKETDLGNANNGNGEGDDYGLYRGLVDKRFSVIPYDFDTLFGQGDTAGKTNDSLFRMTPMTNMNRFVKNPAFAPIYYSQLRDLAQTVVTPAVFNPLIDQMIGGLVPANIITNMKAFAVQRTAYVLSQIPSQISIETKLPAKSILRSTNATVALTGFCRSRFDAVTSCQRSAGNVVSVGCPMDQQQCDAGPGDQSLACAVDGDQWSGSGPWEASIFLRWCRLRTSWAGRSQARPVGSRQMEFTRSLIR